MGNNIGDFYNPAIAVAARSLTFSDREGKEDTLDEIMKGKDDIDKPKVMKHMGDFSCKEELERYVENQELKE